MFVVLLSNIVNESNHVKCVSLSNHYYPFTVKLDRCVGSCNTLNDLSNKVCVPSKTEDLNLSVFIMVSRINELKAITMQISCECKCRFDGRKCNSDQ